MVEIALSALRHLWWGFRALFFLPGGANRLRALGPEPLLLTLVLLAAFALNGAVAVDDVHFSAWGVSCALASLSVITGLLLLGARRRGVDLVSLMSTLIALDIAMLVLMTLAQVAADPLFDALKLSQPWQHRVTRVAGLVWFAWASAALWLLGWRATDVQPRRFALAVLAASLIPAFLLPVAPFVTGASQTDRGLLQRAFDRMQSARAEKPGLPPIDVEAAFTRQPQLIDAALDRLAPSRAGRRELYFVGLAPYAEQDVFKREIYAVRQIVDERLETAGRSLLMLNHRDTVETEPMATMANLDRTLWRLAQIMDTGKDILVLFITTHGSEGAMSVTFRDFELNQITPQRLAAMLERSGIKNRVVILSACHSGSFLPAFTHPDTLVMAAARTDRASFGCENERDWTYFGDAFFNHALRETRSFTAAFERARMILSDWEAKLQAGSPPSLPQIAIGEAIAGKLDDVVQQLERAAQAPSAR